jgi:hypothetical protein
MFLTPGDCQPLGHTMFPAESAPGSLSGETLALLYLSEVYLKTWLWAIQHC